MSLISPEFLLIFLPVSLIVFGFAVRANASWVPAVAMATLSVGFYAGFGLVPLCVLLLSVIANYGASRTVFRYRNSKWPFRAALSGNLALLFCFKYLGVFDFGDDFGFLRFVGLVGVSYFTFQQMAYLLQLRAGLVPLLPAHDYAQFVLFFPILTSGPITRVSEFESVFTQPRELSARNLQVGLTLICIGIAKKVLLAEPLAPAVAHVFSGEVRWPSTLEAWLGALAFTFQVYFDFSGYSDIAVGCARLFGFVLPINFLSPLRSTTIQDFWRRWHMSMTRFFADFVYTPMAVTLTRFSAKHRLPRQIAFALSTAIPTVTTFVLVGLWHDAGVNFLLFGFLHGVALTWYQWRLRSKKKFKSHYQAWGATFLFLVITLVLFRAPEFYTTVRVWGAMFGLGLGGLFGIDFAVFDIWFFGVLSIGAGIVFLCPSTYEFLEKEKPGLSYGVPVLPSALGTRLVWEPTVYWAAGLGALAGFCVIMSMWTGINTFVYVRF